MAGPAERLRDEIVIWLTTVNPAGTPVPTPVWFWYAADEVILFSQPGTAKLRNLRGNPRATLNLNTNSMGGDIVVLSGTVEFADATADELAAYDEKYAEHIERLGMTPDGFHASYSVPLRFRVRKARGVS